MAGVMSHNRRYGMRRDDFLQGFLHQLFVSKYQVALPTPEQLAAIMPRSIQHDPEEKA